jgi:hypothetical protein
MGELLLHVDATFKCPHLASVNNITTTNRKVFVSGKAAVTKNDIFLFSPPPFPDACRYINAAGNPQPCLSIKWKTSASHVFINRQPALLKNSKGICQTSRIPPDQDFPNQVIKTKLQQRVKGS